jgi:Domain of unknown function (DUF4326)
MSDTPYRVRLSRKKGSRMPPNTIKVDRTTRWGNPFHTHGDGRPMERLVAVAIFTYQIQRAGGYIAKLPGDHYYLNTLAIIRKELAGKNLACWCPLDHPCHADELLRIANRDEEKTP